MTARTKGEVVESPTWFGPSDRRLFGWITEPTTGVVGGLLICPSLGRETRAGRRALRALATAAALRGFLALRFDYDGTGDSSGTLDDPSRDEAWTDSVRRGVELLRSWGVEHVSAVGMRLGATILGAAASSHDLGLTSLVLWDPCESGRTYLRELAALEALRREHVHVDTNGAVATSEHVFARSTAQELRRLDLTASSPGGLAKRILVLTRPDRSPSEKLRRRLDAEPTEWRLATDQSSLLDVDPLFATIPTATIDRIVAWLAADGTEPAAEVRIGDGAVDAVLDTVDGPVHETFVPLGPRRLFGIVAEPSTAPTRGPLVVFLNVANEDHTGPSRLWVELSRRWAAHGLRCVRFDLSGLGDSPTFSKDESSIYNQAWLDDTTNVARTLAADDPSNSVYVGLCSGAFWAVEGGLALKSRGVCVVNPPIGIDFLHGLAKLGASRHAALRYVAERLKEVALRLRWFAVVLWKVLRVLAPSVFSVDVMRAVVDDGTDLLVLASSEELSPYPNHRGLDRFFSRRLVAPANYEVRFVEGLDHSLHDPEGRAAAIALLDRHLLERYAQDTPVRDDHDAKERQ